MPNHPETTTVERNGKKVRVNKSDAHKYEQPAPSPESATESQKPKRRTRRKKVSHD